MMDNYCDENRMEGNESEVLLVKENDQSIFYLVCNVIYDQEKKKCGFGWFRLLLGGVIGGSIVFGIYMFILFGDYDVQDILK